VKPLPDPYPIEPLTRPPNCTITVPGSKSITNRALILAALDKEKIELRGALWADDTEIMVNALKKLQFEPVVEHDPTEECNRTITVVGHGGKIPNKKATLNVGNAGTAARFLTAMVALHPNGEYEISGDPRMHERPMKELFDALVKLGARFDFLKSPNHLPVIMYTNGLTSEQLPEHRLRLDASESTQFASALYLVRPHIAGGLLLDLPPQYNPDPLGYIGMTERMISGFTTEIDGGVWIYNIEPDFSSASYFIAAEFIMYGDLSHRVKIRGWNNLEDSMLLQPDREFPKWLKKLTQAPKNTKICVSRRDELGDSILTLAICALFGNASLEIIHANRLRFQETNRIEAMVTELRKVGGEEVAEETDDGFIVHPADPTKLYDNKPKDIETYNDHRMAMCFSALGLKVPGIRIKNPQCVSKTFPNFFEKLEQLRQ
jgi:3-phosphoshikimate 1-carboxyvinyltransferase